MIDLLSLSLILPTTATTLPGCLSAFCTSFVPHNGKSMSCLFVRFSYHVNTLRSPSFYMHLFFPTPVFFVYVTNLRVCVFAGYNIRICIKRTAI